MRNNCLIPSIFCFLIISVDVAFAADYTKYVGWDTRPIIQSPNPANYVNYPCNTYSNRNSLESTLQKMGWTDPEKLLNSFNFSEYEALVITKSSFGENDILKFDSLFTDSNRLVFKYKIKNNHVSGNAGSSASFGLFGHQPAMVAKIPKSLIDRTEKFACRGFR